MKTVIREITEYEANDGSIHSTEDKCREYERRLSLQSIWVIYRKDVVQISAVGSLRLFSTPENAVAAFDAISTEIQALFTIEKMQVDAYAVSVD